MKKIVIGSDHGGFTLKSVLVSFLKSKGYQVKDKGTFSQESCDYPLISYEVAKDVSVGKFKMGILICKSGIGNSIVANKLKGVRAALCYNIKAARLSRQHNDSNILVLGSSFVSAGYAKKITSAWLGAEFEGGRHKRRLKQISKIEKRLGR